MVLLVDERPEELPLVGRTPGVQALYRLVARVMKALDAASMDVLRQNVETREALARHYLQRTSLAAAEISFLLGFSDVSSFSRAYKNWTGIPPSEARQDVA